MRSLKILCAIAVLLVSSHAYGQATCSATLQWVPPTSNTDGSPLTDLSGFRILYGTSATTLNQTITLSNPALTTYIVDALPCGPRYYFALRSVAGQRESVNSNIASKQTQVLPNPNSPVNLRVQESIVYQVVGTTDRFQFLPVGTVPADTACIPAQRVNEYFAVATSAVTWYGSVRPKVVVAKCNG